MIGEIAGALIVGNKLAGAAKNIKHSFDKANRNIQKFYTPKKVKMPKAAKQSVSKSQNILVQKTPGAPTGSYKIPKVKTPKAKSGTLKKMAPKPVSAYSPEFLKGLIKGLNK